MLVKLICLFLIGVAFAEQFPNYITEEEFAKARSNPIHPAPNGTVLPLSPIEEAQLPSPRPGFGPRLWTNSLVPYTLDPSFSAQQREIVAQALDAYHRDTCIRFIPKTSQGSWVDILHDPAVCGVAHVCMNSGAQFAKFGGSCVNAGVMVHELGHTLCMGHEQTRRDRDNWIDWNTNICQPHGIDGPDFNRGLHKLYDFVSIEHYEGECYNGCIVPKIPGVTKCGSGGPLGVLDIEILNEMYGCPGCQSYRFINPALAQLNNPVITGRNHNGGNIYTCRAYHQGDILPGKYDLQSGECHVSHNGAEHSKRSNLEVLCNPTNQNFHWIRAGTPPGNAIRGGRSNERVTLYIIRCEFTGAMLPGKYQPGVGAYISYGGQEYRCNDYDFLVCS